MGKNKMEKILKVKSAGPMGGEFKRTSKFDFHNWCWWCSGPRWGRTNVSQREKQLCQGHRGSVWCGLVWCGPPMNLLQGKARGPIACLCA